MLARDFSVMHPCCPVELSIHPARSLLELGSYDLPPGQPLLLEGASLPAPVDEPEMGKSQLQSMNSFCLEDHLFTIQELQLTVLPLNCDATRCCA